MVRYACPKYSCSTLDWSSESFNRNLDHITGLEILLCFAWDALYGKGLQHIAGHRCRSIVCRHRHRHIYSRCLIGSWRAVFLPSTIFTLSQFCQQVSSFLPHSYFCVLKLLLPTLSRCFLSLMLIISELQDAYFHTVTFTCRCSLATPLRPFRESLDLQVWNGTYNATGT